MNEQHALVTQRFEVSNYDLAATLGAGYDREVVHRDDLVLMQR